MLKKLLIVVVAVVCGASNSFGDIIFQIVSADPSSTVVGQATGVLGTGYSRGAGLAAQGGGSTFNSDNFTLNGTETSAVANNDFVQWSFTSSNAYDLQNFDIRYDRSPQGPINIRIDFQSNGGVFSTVFVDTSVDADGENNIGISLNSTGVTSGVFRLYGWGATSTAGTFDLENASAIGTNAGNNVSFELHGITAVPEPSSIALFSLMGCTGLIAVYRRRRAKFKVA